MYIDTCVWVYIRAPPFSHSHLHVGDNNKLLIQSTCFIRVFKFIPTSRLRLQHDLASKVAAFFAVVASTLHNFKPKRRNALF